MVDIDKATSNIQKESRAKAGEEGLFKIPGGKIDNKAARLLLLLGPDEAKRIMAGLSPEEVRELTRQMAGIRQIDTNDAKILLEELNQYFDKIEAKEVRGGIDAARRILSGAFGVSQAEEILAQSIPQSHPGPFSFLNELTTSQLLNLLQKESPRTLALIMAYIAPSQASRILKSLSGEVRIELILRMARTEKISREIIQTTEEILRDKLRLIGSDDSETIDGCSVLADILRCMDMEDERRIMKELDGADPHLTEQIQMKLYTMELVLKMRDKDLQHILRELTETDIVMLLKGQSQEIKDNILDSLSARRRLIIEEEAHLIGSVPRKDADTVVRDFLMKMREGEDNGTYIILRHDEDLIE